MVIRRSFAVFLTIMPLAHPSSRCQKAAPQMRSVVVCSHPPLPRIIDQNRRDQLEPDACHKMASVAFRSSRKTDQRYLGRRMVTWLTP